MNLLSAIQFANKCHLGQYRKYTNRPYIEHPMRVMCGYAVRDDATEEGCMAAVNHDVAEDCNVSWEELGANIGDIASDLVFELTNPSKKFPELNRKARKEMDREHLRDVSKTAKILKLIDRIDNLNEMHRAERVFIYKYCDESRLLGEVLRSADEELYQELIETINRLENNAK